MDYDVLSCVFMMDCMDCMDYYLVSLCPTHSNASKKSGKKKKTVFTEICTDIYSKQEKCTEPMGPVSSCSLLKVHFKAERLLNT